MRVPPDPIPNSEVKTHSADDSVGSPHVKVGHCQALNTKSPVERSPGLFVCCPPEMSDTPIILAMANPIPEIMPDVPRDAGSALLGTGRSDFPNQVNNVLAFPGSFRGALDAGAQRITEEMKLAAARALAAFVESPTADLILSDALDSRVAARVAAAVAEPS